jgi:hypothetical protein
VSFEEKRLRVLALALTLFSAPQAGDELFFQYAYNQLNTEVKFMQVSKNTPLCLHMLYKVNYSFDWQQPFLLLQDEDILHIELT